jgi:hypothetical protein
MAMALIQVIIYQMTMTKKLTTTIPPKRGPNPQGLNIPLKQVKTSNTPENINGRYRQIVTKRKNIDRG